MFLTNIPNIPSKKFLTIIERDNGGKYIPKWLKFVQLSPNLKLLGKIFRAGLLRKTKRMN